MRLAYELKHLTQFDHKEEVVLGDGGGGGRGGQGKNTGRVAIRVKG